MHADADPIYTVSDSLPSVSPSSSSVVVQREGMINQPLSAPASPLSSLSSPITQLNLSSLEDCTQDPNWQATKSTVRERNAAMFNNHLMADIMFIVGSPGHTQTIPAHKYVLATGSSVFYAMFYGGLAENKSDIEVPDVEPAAFLALLKYMYCDEVQLEADTVLATLYVAKKYIVPHLAKACVNYLETSLTAKNACLLLSQSRLFEEPDLMQRCWEVIDAQVSFNQKMLKSYLTLNKPSDTADERGVRPNSFYSCDDICLNGKSESAQSSSSSSSAGSSRSSRSGRSHCSNFRSRLSVVPHCFSLSENDCYSLTLHGSHISFSLFRTRSEPYFSDSKLGIEIMQNITYQDNCLEDYECNGRSKQRRFSTAIMNANETDKYHKLRKKLIV